MVRAQLGAGIVFLNREVFCPVMIHLIGVARHKTSAMIKGTSVSLGFTLLGKRSFYRSASRVFVVIDPPAVPIKGACLVGATRLKRRVAVLIEKRATVGAAAMQRDVVVDTHEFVSERYGPAVKVDSGISVSFREYVERLLQGLIPSTVEVRPGNSADRNFHKVVIVRVMSHVIRRQRWVDCCREGKEVDQLRASGGARSS